MDEMKEILDKSVNVELSVKSSWGDFSSYFQKLIDANGEPRMRSTSGMLTIQYLPDGKMEAEIGGYDTLTICRHHYVSAETEEGLKEQIIEIFEKERLQLLYEEENEEEEEEE